MAKELTPKQAHFARCVAQGMTQADAYREAYDPKQSTAASIHTLASRLMGQVEIRSRVDALIKARERAVVASALYGQRQSSKQAQGLARGHRGNRQQSASCGRASGQVVWSVCD
jgi:hypothetical protein